MNEQIAEFPNTAFYDGKLEIDDRNRSWRIDGFAPIVGFDIVEPEKRTRSKSYKNGCEAQVAAKEVQKLLESEVDPHDIGIITPYTGQIGTIYQALSQLDVNTQAIKVDTVDSFQGGERDVIIVSFVRSNEYNNAGFLTFPDEGPRRLNVALTRARKRLVVIGDFDTLGSYSDIRNSSTSCADVYSSLFTYLSELGVVHTN